ncbi:MAG TPA: 1-(5-phosphoribosyl)-5-[(5-phosphoribosylamino)methylideneamino]imidazole-4-carboxamide isomerase [Pyrinomonadaceae bacterium]|jgi:phosphoribosylformimino-5-aminoimidazole carboxamide ribotide isomerase|nr:1-(5-phosphoribosyl)-5-[(5-phosphoribosylamino)methylideneamino]imidazole-4-carboxamide isomerase [Pyrinomonadaceae bacterium]
MIVIPAIDLKNGLCVRLMQGRKSEMTIYNENPVEVAREFASAGAEMIHVVDLDGAFNEADSPNRAVVRKIVDAVDVAVEFGGGVRTLEDVQRLCDAGVARVVLGTLAVESPDTLKNFVNQFPSKICVGIDARDGRVMSRGWETSTPVMAVDLARSVAESGVERIIYTDIARDGTLGGPNLEQTLAVIRAANVPVTASGGVSSLDDIKRLRDTGEPLLDSVIVGKALYEGKFKLGEAIRAADLRG